MGYFLVKFEDKIYANTDLYVDAIAKGERAFQKMLGKSLHGRLVLDQALFPISPEQRALCDAYHPVLQDFDDAIRHLNIVSKNTLEQIAGIFRTAVITIDSAMIPDRLVYKYLTFFKVRDWNDMGVKKYRAIGKMAAIKLCGFLYVALNAVDVRVDAPIIAMLKTATNN